MKKLLTILLMLSVSPFAFAQDIKRGLQMHNRFNHG